MRCSSRRIDSSPIRISRLNGIAAPISSRRSAIAAIVTLLAIYCLELNNHRKFAGAITQGWKAYNITPDLPWGIGSWSDEQLQGYLSRGHADGRGPAGGPMAEVVDYSLNFLSDADIHAMITYLKSVPSNSDARDDAAAPTPSSQQEVNSKSF